MSLSVQDDIAHIRELNKITRTTSAMRPIIDQYRTHLDSPMHEEGVEFRFANNNYSSFPAISQLSYAVRFAPAVMTSLIRIHKHHLESDPVFSAGDIFAMAEFYRQKSELNAPDKDNITSAIVSKNGLYAFRITDPQKVLQFREALGMEMNQVDRFGNKITFKVYLEKKYLRDVVERSQNQCGGTCSDEEYDMYLHQNFIKFFNRIPDLGISVFYAPHNENGVYTWTKISEL